MSRAKPTGNSSPELVVLSRPTGWWVAPSNDNARYAAGPFASEAEARAWVATLAPAAP